MSEHPRDHREGGDEGAHETVNRESHPNAAGPDALSGDLGVSSGREGPFQGIEGTGSLESAQHATDGEAPTDRGTVDDVDDVDAVDPGRGSDDPDDSARASGVDRTVGEVRPDPVANKHEFDPSRNPRH
jgi:hypothetical protein